MIRKLLFHNFIFIYRGSHWLRQHLTSSGMLLLSALTAAAVFGLDTRQTLSYQIFALLLSIFILAMFSVIIFRGKFMVRRSLPDYGTRGQMLSYEVTLRNTGTRKHHDLELIDELATTFPDYQQFTKTSDTEDVHRNLVDRYIGYPRLVSLIGKIRGGWIRQTGIGQISPGETIHKTMELMPLRRGYLYFSRTLVGRSDPFGLLRRFRKYDHHDSLLILPKLYDLAPPRLNGARKYQHGGLSLASSVGDSEEFFSLRDYRPGDPLRAIHWVSYAKRGTPVVKEYQDEYFSRLGLILDTFPGQRSDLLFEEAVSVAASIATSSLQQDSLLDLIFINDRAWRFTAGRSLAGVENVLEILACVTRSPVDNMEAMEKLLLQHSTQTSGFICVLLGWDEKRRHLVRQLLTAGHPVMVYVITEAAEIKPVPDDPMRDRPGQFCVLPAGNIQTSLDKHGHGGPHDKSA